MTGLAPDSSSTSYKWIYDVFINFRGEDTRHGFTGNLYNTLNKAGFCTFIDDKKLRRGDEITPTLIKAIENSRMAITVFSENYASSTFCLNELVKIHQCIKGKGRSIWPIFYNVDPSEVRHQKGNYKQVLTMNKTNPKVDKKMIQSWQHALHEVANFSGFHHKPGHCYEYEFIETIVKAISKEMMNVSPLYVAKYPVGIEPRMQKMKSLLQIELNDKVIMAGIYGIGGMGKTTIASAVYNSVAKNFECVCFIHDIKEKPLGRTQEIMLSKIVGECIKIEYVNESVELIKQRFKHRKVLLILDNVDKDEQLEKLAGDPNWFGAGSRIIITTRDIHLLQRHKVARKYEIEALSFEESIELLNLIALDNNQENPSYVNALNRRVIACAEGLPLALKVIGSNLYGMTKSECESALDLYERIPDKDILDKLKVSYDGLKPEEQQVFLDIACFFKLDVIEYVKYIVEQVRDFNPEYVISVLVNKCLMKIDGYYFKMHDLIRHMGRKIICEESDEPGERSRLRLHEEIAHVLEEDTGTNKVQIIIQDIHDQCIEINWDGEALKSMKRLKILLFRKVKFSEGPKYLPNSLKVLAWPNYPSSCLPPNFCPKKLVELHLQDSYLSSLEAIKTLNNLRKLNLRGCQYIIEIPDLSNLINLKVLFLRGCNSLFEIHDSIGNLCKLEVLDATYCVQLKVFPREFKSSSLRRLHLNHCSSLNRFPEILEKVKITHLSLFGTAIEKLPWSICNLSELREFSWISESGLEIPNNIFLLPKLEKIFIYTANVTSCNSKEAQEEAIWSQQCDPCRVRHFKLKTCNISNDLLRTFLSHFINLQHLELIDCNFTILPACIKECHSLQELHLDDCEHLREVEGIPPNIGRLEAKNCISLSLESKSLLLSEELLGAPSTQSSNSYLLRQMHLCVPSTSIPTWFHHRSKGASISFWFRNSFPTLRLCVLFKPTDVAPHLGGGDAMFVSVYINEERVDWKELWRWHALNGDHLIAYILNADVIPDGKKERVCGKNTWNYVQVCAYPYATGDIMVIEDSGIYVIHHLCEMEDITFNNPTLDSTSTHRDKDYAEVINDTEIYLRKQRDRGWFHVDDDDDENSKTTSNGEASLRNLDRNATSLPMLPCPKHAPDSFRNQEFQPRESAASTNVEQVPKSIEGNRKVLCLDFITLYIRRFLTYIRR